MAGKDKGKRRRFGSVRQLPSGRYQARYQGPDGLLRPAPHTFATETDAEVWLTVTEADMVRGTWFDPDVGRVPLGDYAKRWIAERPGLSPRTLTLYEGLLRLHIAPHLGGIDLVTLTPARVRQWRKDLLDGGLGEVTVAKCYRLLRSILNTAVEDDELIRRNPCRIKGAGRESSAERPVATPAQVQALAAAMPSRWRALVLLAVASSLRWGELMALTRADVDVKARTVRVARSLSDDRGRMTLGPTKSEAGKRTVAIPAGVVPVLKAHLRELSEKGAAGRVFVGAKGATLRRTNFQAMWVKAVKAAGLPEGFRFHDLRHTGNTWAAGSGANLRELMERMGHSSERAALIYLHAASEGHRRIADGIDRMLSGEEEADDQDGDDDDDGSSGVPANA
jgi:integrase